MIAMPEIPMLATELAIDRRNQIITDLNLLLQDIKSSDVSLTISVRFKKSTDYLFDYNITRLLFLH